MALGSKAVALSKGSVGASGAFKGITGLALGGGAAAALATSKDSDSTEIKAAVGVADPQKLPNVTLSQQGQDTRLPRR